MLRYIWPLLSLSLMVVAADAQVTIQWKLVEGQSFYMKTEVDRRMKLKISGQTMEQNKNSKIVQRLKVLKLLDGGRAKLEHKIVASKSVENGVEDKEFSSMFKNATFQVTYTKFMKPVKLAGRDSFIKSLAEGNAETERMIRSVLSEPVIMLILAMPLGNVPEQAVKEGDKWRRPLAVPIGPLGRVTLDNTYQYAGKGELNGVPMEKFDFAGNLHYEAPKKADSRLGFQVTAGEFTAKKLTGLVFFDVAAGRMARWSLDLKMTGRVEMQVGQGKVTVDVDGVESSKAMLHDKEPSVD